MKEFRRWLWMLLGYKGRLPATLDDINVWGAAFNKRHLDTTKVQMDAYRAQLFEFLGKLDEKTARRNLAGSILSGMEKPDIEEALRLADELMLRTPS